jgi:hypothetical protein
MTIKMHAQATSPEIDLNKLLNFLGFGNPRAATVFIGMEEGLSPTPPLRDQLIARSCFPKLIGLKDSADAHADRFFRGEHPPVQSTWNIMIRVLLAIEGRRTPSLDEIRAYQRDRLGALGGDAALLELMPLPAPRLPDWPYADIAEVAGRFPTRKQYADSQLSDRIEMLREHLGYGPKLTIAYGSAYWPYYKRIFREVSTWQRHGVFEFARVGPRTIILAPHFVARQMNGQRETLIDLALNA